MPKAKLDNGGPFTVVDAATTRPLRGKRFWSLDDAFMFGYNSKTCEDFVVLDNQLNPVPYRRRK